MSRLLAQRLTEWAYGPRRNLATTQKIIRYITPVINETLGHDGHNTGTASEIRVPNTSQRQRRRRYSGMHPLLATQTHHLSTPQTVLSGGSPSSNTSLQSFGYISKAAFSISASANEMRGRFDNVQPNAFDSEMSSRFPNVQQNAFDTDTPGRFVNLHQNAFDKFLPETAGGLRDWTVVDWGASYFEYIHDLTGLQWGHTIVLGGLLSRAVLFLFTRHFQDRQTIHLDKHMPKLQKQLDKLKIEVAVAEKRGMFASKRQASLYRKEEYKQITMEHQIKYKAHPRAMIWIPLLHGATFLSLSFGLRDLIGFTPGQHDFRTGGNPEIGESGFLWISNLLTPDNTYGLPLLMFVSSLAAVETQSLRQTERNILSRVGLNLFRLMSIYVAVLSGYVPSGLAVYWCTSNVAALMQILFQMSPTYRRLFRLPKTKNDSDTPYRDMCKEANNRFNKRFRKKQVKAQENEVVS